MTEAEERRRRTSVLAAARRVCGAPFACRLERAPSGWLIRESSGLDRRLRTALQQGLRSARSADRLSAALTSSKPVEAPQALFPAGVRAQLFPAGPRPDNLLLVGRPAGGLPPDARRVFQAIARRPEGRDDEPAELAPAAGPFPAIELDSVLRAFTQAIRCDGADLAVRWGSRFRVAVVEAYPESWVGSESRLGESPLEARLVRTRRPVLQTRLRGGGRAYPAGFRVASWLGVPLVVGERVIARVGLASRKAVGFEAGDLATARRLAAELAAAVEGILLFQEATQRLARLAMVQEVAPLGATLGEPERIIARVLSILRRTFNTPWVAYLAPAASGEGFDLRRGEGQAGGDQAEGKAAQSAWRRLSAQVKKTGGPVVRVRHGWFRPGAAIALGASIRFGDRLLGFLIIESDRPNAYAEDDERLLLNIAGQVASFLENARLYREMGVAVEQLSAVRQTALDLASQVDHPEVLENLAERVQLLLRVPGVELGLVDAENRNINLVVSRNPWGSFRGLDIGLGEGLEGRAAREGKVMVEPASQWWAGRGLGRRSRGRAACLPLRWGEEVIGVLTVIDDDPRRSFSMEDMRLLELLAPQAAITLRNARLLQDQRNQMEERKRTEAQLIQSAKMAALGQMAAGVAHEINNPLTTVAGFTELWLEEMAGENPMRSELEMVTKETRRARQVVSRLLDFARQRSALMEPADPNEIVREGLDLVRHFLALHGVELRERYGADLPWVALERGGIKQVLLNLAHNAVQAMPLGGVLIVETGTEDRSAAPGVFIRIRDTGEGIAPENLRHIFEPFFTTKKPGEGTGLGLAVSYGIIADHGGAISVASEPGEGAEFHLWLPARKADSP